MHILRANMAANIICYWTSLPMAVNEKPQNITTNNTSKSTNICRLPHPPLDFSQQCPHCYVNCVKKQKKTVSQYTNCPIHIVKTMPSPSWSKLLLVPWLLLPAEAPLPWAAMRFLLVAHKWIKTIYNGESDVSASFLDLSRSCCLPEPLHLQSRCRLLVFVSIIQYIDDGDDDSVQSKPT